MVQLELHKDKDKAIQHAIDKIDNACVAGSEIICLPEQWYPTHITNMEDELSFILNISKERNVCIIAGAFIERIDDSWYISTPVIQDGRIIGKQFKIHPFINEREFIKSGNKLNIFEYHNIRFGIAICHDIVFPEISRALTLKGADIIFYPSKIRREGIEPWHIYVKARALENRVIAVAPNVFSEIFGGRSIIVDISYIEELNIAKVDYVEAASSSEQILVSDLDIEKVRRIREIRLNELREDYSLLIS